MDIAAHYLETMRGFAAGYNGEVGHQNIRKVKAHKEADWGMYYYKCHLSHSVVIIRLLVHNDIICRTMK